MKNWFLVTALVAVLSAGCSSNPKTDAPRDPSDRPDVLKEKDNPLEARRRELRDARLNAEQLYRRARRDLDSSDFSSAIEGYDNLSKRHPFSDYTTQGEMERIYALYRNFEPDRALSSADRFLREHPRHPEIDYIYYLKGLINYSRDEADFSILPVDETKSDVTSQRRAFDDFALLIQKFPDSRYVGDAYSRMVYIRNRLGAHELHVVDFYVSRGAYVAAAKRAEQIIAQYPGTPASHKALKVLLQCYELAGLKQQADDARALLKAQPTHASLATDAPAPSTVVAAAPPAEQPKRGFFASIVDFFSPLDSSRPGAGVEIVIPSAKSKAEAEAAGASPAAGEQAATAAPAAAAGADAAAGKKSTKLEVFYEPYDDGKADSADATPAAPATPAKP